MKVAFPAIAVAIEKPAYEIHEDVPGGALEIRIRAQLLPGFPTPTRELVVGLVTEGVEGGAGSPGDYAALSDRGENPCVSLGRRRGDRLADRDHRQ